MLNLFIAIISESFDKINSQNTRASFREKAGLIAENQFLLTKESKSEWVQKNKYLLFVEYQGNDKDNRQTADDRTQEFMQGETDRIEANLDQT